MKKILFISIVTVVITIFCSLQGNSAEVAQGKCISFDASASILVIEEYTADISKENPYGKPTGIKNSYKTKDALIGAVPSPGDIIRIAYEVKGTERLAIKIMNISKQDLMKK